MFKILLLTKIIAAQNEITLRYRRVRLLYFLTVVFAKNSDPVFRLAVIERAKQFSKKATNENTEYNVPV